MGIFLKSKLHVLLIGKIINSFDYVKHTIIEVIIKSAYFSLLMLKMS